MTTAFTSSASVPAAKALASSIATSHSAPFGSQMSSVKVDRPQTPINEENLGSILPHLVPLPSTPKSEMVRKTSFGTFGEGNLTPPSQDRQYYQNRSAASSATAFEMSTMNNSASFLIIDPRFSDSDAGFTTSEKPQRKKKKVDFNKPIEFWLIFISLCFSVLLSALDLTAISTALPEIINDLNGEDYIWVGSAYALTSTAFLPFCGSMANILGRRSTMIFSLLIFMLGSGLCGGSKYVNSMKMLIASRAIQGVGGGGILAMTEIIVADMLPLSERGVFSGIIGCIWAFASAIGPLIGGALAKRWQWLFFINLPLGILALTLVWIFLDIKAPKEDLRTRLQQMDIVGNSLIIGGTTAVIIAIVWGGSDYPWTSYQVLLPLLIGIAATGLAGFYDYRYAVDPTIPFAIINNRTSISGYIQTFFHGIVTMIIIYYLPVYFQAVRGSSALRSSIQSFPLSLTIAPIAIVTGAAVAIVGKYNWANWSGWILMTTGVGLMALLKEGSPVSMWAGFQAIAGTGAGILFSGLNFPILAPTPPRLNAPALAFLTFARSYGQVFGVTIGGSAMNNKLKTLLPEAFRAKFGNTPDLAYAAIPIICDLAEPLKSEVIHAFIKSLKWVWIVCIPLSAFGLIANVFCKEIPMHEKVDENWGLHEKETIKNEESGEVGRSGEETGMAF